VADNATTELYALALEWQTSDTDSVVFIPAYCGRLELISKEEALKRAEGELRSGMKKVWIVPFPMIEVAKHEDPKHG